MKLLLATTVVLMTGVGAGWAQTCGDVINDASASCPTVLDSGAGGTTAAAPNGSNGSALGAGSRGPVIDNRSTGNVIDSTRTDAIPDVPAPKGMAPLVVPTDPLNRGETVRPNTGKPTGIINPTVPAVKPGATGDSGTIPSPSIN